MRVNRHHQKQACTAFRDGREAQEREDIGILTADSLDSKEIKPVSPKGNQPSIYIHGKD